MPDKRGASELADTGKRKRTHSATARRQEEQEEVHSDDDDLYFTESEEEDEEVIDSEAMEGAEGGEGMDVDTGVAHFEGRSIMYAPQPDLECEDDVYDMKHTLGVECPYLSFDVIQDQEGLNRRRYPLGCILVAGTGNNDKGYKPALHVMKVGSLCKTRSDDASDDEDEDANEEEEEDDDTDPTLFTKNVKHHGHIQRVRAMQQTPGIVATWSEGGRVCVYDLRLQVEALATPERYAHRVAGGGARATEDLAPILVSKPSDHERPGWALSWNPMEEGTFASGDETGRVNIWRMQGSGEGYAEASRYQIHDRAVEDLQWCPSKPDLLVSCGGDSKVKLWDARSGKIHREWLAEEEGVDINCLSWNSFNANFVLTGADNGNFRVWDIRKTKEAVVLPMATFDTHRECRKGNESAEQRAGWYITSVEWSPTSSTLFLVADDEQVTLWDMSAEKDDDMTAYHYENGGEAPPQLMFQHPGITGCRDVHWHRQVPGMVIDTYEAGMEFWKPMTWKSLIK